MPHFDLPLDALWSYAPDIEVPADFDAFWDATLAEFSPPAFTPRFDALDDARYARIRVFDVTFSGFAGQPIKAWLLTPTAVGDRLPTIVSYVGYGGGRGWPVAHLAPVVAGFAHFVMDTRGQGSGWSPGETPDVIPPQFAAGGFNPQFPGFLTRGITSRETYYYRRVFVDAVCAVAAAARHPHVDATRIMVSGASQGAGIALAVAGLIPDKIRAVCADVPFLCHFRRATTLVDAAPYNEIARYLACHRTHVARVYDTLTYFDGCAFAPRIQTPALFSVGLMDQTCPPSTAFAAYHRLATPAAQKTMRVYEFNQHEGGGDEQLLARLEFARRVLT